MSVPSGAQLGKPTHVPSILFDGDSITAGTGGQTPWPTAAIDGAAGMPYVVNRIVPWRNQAVIGSPITQAPNGARAAFLYILLSGTNDLLAGLSGPVCFANLKLAAARALGSDTIREYCSTVVLVGTVLPSTAISGALETARLSLNTSILAARPCVDAPWSGAVPFATGANLTDPTNVTYFLDGTHLTTAGGVAAANVAVPYINEFLATSLL